MRTVGERGKLEAGGGRETLIAMREDAKSQQSKLNSQFRLSLLVGSGALVVTVFLASWILNARLGTPERIFWLSVLTLVFVIYACAFLANMGHNRQRVRLRDQLIQELDFQLDLEQDRVSEDERRAEKTLWQHDRRLLSYYSLNLKQNATAFHLGIFCIVSGILLIVLTGLVVVSLVKDTESKIIVAALGVVSSVLTNYVAAIYVKMHAAASINLGKFHSRLVDTHQVLFASLIASRIADERVRWRTLSKMAVNLSNLRDSEPKEE